MCTRLLGDETGRHRLYTLDLGAERDARNVLHERRMAGDTLGQSREVAHAQRDALLGVCPQQLRHRQKAKTFNNSVQPASGRKPRADTARFAVRKLCRCCVENDLTTRRTVIYMTVFARRRSASTEQRPAGDGREALTHQVKSDMTHTLTTWTTSSALLGGMLDRLACGSNSPRRSDPGTTSSYDSSRRSHEGVRPDGMMTGRVDRRTQRDK